MEHIHQLFFPFALNTNFQPCSAVPSSSKLFAHARKIFYRRVSSLALLYKNADLEDISFERKQFVRRNYNAYLRHLSLAFERAFALRYISYDFRFEKIAAINEYRAQLPDPFLLNGFYDITRLEFRYTTKFEAGFASCLSSGTGGAQKDLMLDIFRFDDERMSTSKEIYYVNHLRSPFSLRNLSGLACKKQIHAYSINQLIDLMHYTRDKDVFILCGEMENQPVYSLHALARQLVFLAFDQPLQGYKFFLKSSNSHMSRVFCVRCHDIRLCSNTSCDFCR